MTQKLVLWDWNGCLLDDCEHIYTHGPVRIFEHFGLPAPPLEAFRNDVTGDFMNSFYYPHGIPKDVTAEDLNAIMKQGFEEHGEPPLQTDAAETLEALRAAGHLQVLVTGYGAELLPTSLEHHGLAGYFLETHGSVRKKAPVFRDILARHECEPEHAIGVTDTLADVAMLEEAGVRPFICPRGFHGRPRIDAARADHTDMVVIDDLKSLLRYL